MSMDDVKDVVVKRQRIDQDRVEISLKTLINYMWKDELVRLLTPETWTVMENGVKNVLGVSKVDTRTLKGQVAENIKYDAAARRIKQSPLWGQTLQKYYLAAERMRQARPRAQTVRKGMTKPRRQYLGCLASKLQPQDYKDCLETYDTNPAFEKLRLVPKQLKAWAYDRTTDVVFREAVQGSLKNLPPLSYLPSGYRKYIEANPQDFAQYYEDLRTQRRIMNAILRPMKPQQLEKLESYIQENRSLDINKLNEIIGRHETKFDDDSSDTSSILGNPKDLKLWKR